VNPLYEILLHPDRQTEGSPMKHTLKACAVVLMKPLPFLLLLLSMPMACLAENWPLDGVDGALIVRGTAKSAAGASRQSLVLDGESLIELKDSAKLASGAFTLSLWFNPYDLAGGQQMLAGKNRYSRNERQWSLTIEPDGKLKAYLRRAQPVPHVATASTAST